MHLAETEVSGVSLGAWARMLTCCLARLCARNAFQQLVGSRVPWAVIPGTAKLLRHCAATLPAGPTGA